MNASMFIIDPDRSGVTHVDITLDPYRLRKKRSVVVTRSIFSPLETRIFSSSGYVEFPFLGMRTRYGSRVWCVRDGRSLFRLSNHSQFLLIRPTKPNMSMPMSLSEIEECFKRVEREVGAKHITTEEAIRQIEQCVASIEQFHARGCEKFADAKRSYDEARELNIKILSEMDKGENTVLYIGLESQLADMNRTFDEVKAEHDGNMNFIVYVKTTAEWTMSRIRLKS